MRSQLRNPFWLKLLIRLPLEFATGIKFASEPLARNQRSQSPESAVNALLREGSIVKLDSDRENGPFFALVGYREPADRLGNLDLVSGRDYSGQYEAPIWRDDA